VGFNGPNHGARVIVAVGCREPRASRVDGVAWLEWDSDAGAAHVRCADKRRAHSVSVDIFCAF
jgi:hypothetical protein